MWTSATPALSIPARDVREDTRDICEDGGDVCENVCDACGDVGDVCGGVCDICDDDPQPASTSVRTPTTNAAKALCAPTT